MKPLLLLFALLPYSLYAQSFLLSGTVTNTDGEPLIGASVYDVVQQTGTITDLDGRYQLQVAANTELEFSYVGHESAYWFVSSGLSKSHNVVLETGYYLDEIVVVAYPSSSIDCHTTGCFVDCFLSCYSTTETLSTATKAPPPLSPLQAATVFPNPFVDHLAVDIHPNTPTTFSAVLLDVSGRTVRRWASRQLAPGASTLTYRLGTARLLPGTYLLRLTDQNGHIEVRKVIKTDGA